MFVLKYIIILYVIGWFIQMVNPVFYDSVLALDMAKVFHGQVWRLVTFIIMPPENSNAFFMIFSL